LNEQFASVHQSLDKASAIAKSLYEENMADYEESERIRIKHRILESMVAIVRGDADDRSTISFSTTGKMFGVETGSWLTRFRIVRKMKGGHWELWYSSIIDHERWVQIRGNTEEESLAAPIGIAVKSVESY